MAGSLLDKEFLQRLEYLYIVTRELFLGHVSAERLSRKFGVGMEFADYRAYTSGDDYRYIDWAAYARRDDLLIKLFTEERANHIYLVLDASRSMTVGNPEKLFFAKKIAAALGYIGLANLDPVTVVSFHERLRDDGHMFQGRGRLRHMLATLEEIAPGGTNTSLGTTMRELVRRFPSHGLVVVISDFLDREGYEETVRLLHYHRFELVAVQVNDREELEPTATGDLEMIDSETLERTIVRVTPGAIAEYKARINAHYAELARLCKLLHRGHLPVLTDTPFENVIFDVFRRSGFLR
jgi:uncharacterized protein (DUF58 family)